MELSREEFDEVMDYHHTTFEVVLENMDIFIKSLETRDVSGKQIFVSIIPIMAYPPQASLVFTIDGVTKEGEASGFFNITRHYKNNLH